MTTIGIIGLGRIGGRLAENLLAAGFSVVGCDIAARPAFVAEGGTFTHSPVEVARSARIILHSLPDAGALDDVVSKLSDVCSAEHVIADLSTYPLARKLRARDRLARCGAAFLDCQISGSPEMLAEGRGVIFASGDRAAAERCTAAFGAAVERQFYVGEFGAATKLKTANNLLVALNTAAAAEALALAVKAGIDPKLAVDVIGSGAARSQMFAQRAPLMAERHYPNDSSTLSSFTVYLDLIEAALSETPIDAPLATAALELYRRALSAGLGDQDMACVYEMIYPREEPTAASVARR